MEKDKSETEVGSDLGNNDSTTQEKKRELSLAETCRYDEINLAIKEGKPYRITWEVVPLRTLALMKERGLLILDNDVDHKADDDEPTDEKMVETETSGRGKRRRVEQEHRPDLNKTAAPRGSAEDNVLPFTKTLPSWKEYESDEVYKRTPQRPHFPSLAYSCELFREGIAAGLTGAFIKCVKTVDDDMGEDTPRSKLDVYKETFVMLEEQGFDVRAPLSRINELLSLQNGLPNMLKKEMRGESSNKKAKAGLNKKPSFKTKEMARKSTVKQDRLNFLYEKQREIREGSSKEPKLNKSLVRCKSSFEDKETAK